MLRSCNIAWHYRYGRVQRSQDGLEIRIVPSYGLATSSLDMSTIVYRVEVPASGDGRLYRSQVTGTKRWMRLQSNDREWEVYETSCSAERSVALALKYEENRFRPTEVWFTSVLAITNVGHRNTSSNSMKTAFAEGL